mgnify:CR=1 FL=1
MKALLFLALLTSSAYACPELRGEYIHCSSTIQAYDVTYVDLTATDERTFSIGVWLDDDVQGFDFTADGVSRETTVFQNSEDLHVNLKASCTEQELRVAYTSLEPGSPQMTSVYSSPKPRFLKIENYENAKLVNVTSCRFL